MAAESERDGLARAAARCFAGADGRRVLAHLAATTLGRATPAELDGATLRHLEGQRWLVRQLFALIERGGGRPPALRPTDGQEVPDERSG